MPATVKIFTMNIWGIPLVAKQKTLRVKALAEALASKDYDIVCLQEVWDVGDYEFLYSKLANKMPEKYYFHSGLLGSGLCLFSKWPIIRTFYYKFPLNGYVHKIHHGDWLAGKGVALSQIQMNDKIINVFNTHLHAQYCEENDEYLSHRLSQAYEVGQLINLSSESGALTLLVGDCNSRPSDICLRLLCALGSLQDSFLHKDEEDDFGTNESTRNSFAPAKAVQRNPHGSRLDYILFTSNNSHSATSISYDFALPNRIPGTDLSYSDHEAVEATIHLAERLNTEPSKRDPDCELIQSSYDVCENGLRQVAYKIRWVKGASIIVLLSLVFIIQLENGNLLSPFQWFLVYFPLIGLMVISALFFVLYNIEYRSLRGIQQSIALLSPQARIYTD